MSIIDFKEIAKGNGNTGDQDKFELFTREFFEFLGYIIISSPDRGADGGKDLIVREIRKGVGGTSKIDWVVSCKHYAHSGKSVSPSTEANIRDRIESHNCKGFIGFYSTIPSSGLSNILIGLKNKIEVQQFDSEKIEAKLFSDDLGIELAERFFPLSIERWRNLSDPLHAIKSAQNISREWASIIKNEIFKNTNSMSQKEFFEKAKKITPLDNCEDLKAFFYWAVENKTVVFASDPLNTENKNSNFISLDKGSLIVHLNKGQYRY